MKQLVLILAIISLCSCSRLEESNTLRMNLGFEPPTLDWNLADDFTSFDVISNIMVGLTRFGVGTNGEIIAIPGCAKSWDINEDASEYIFHLNPEAVWTDGKPVIAQDFIDSFTRLLDPATAAPYAELLSMIDLAKTKAIDDLTLKVVLKHPAAYFIYLTSYGLTLPIRKDIIERHGNSWTEPKNIVSNGPFKLKQWQHEYKIILERNEGFHLDRAKMQYLKFFMVPEQASAYTLYKNNQFDWIDRRSIPVSEFKRLKAKDKPERISLLRNTYIGFNTKMKPFDSHLVRQAFSYAIDRATLTKIRSLGDQPNNTWIPPSLSKFLDHSKLQANYSNLGYHPEMARNKLREAGFPDGKGFPELEFLVPSREDSKLLAEALQSMWTKELNITVNITTMEWKVFLATLKDNPPHLFRLNWGADYPDPDTFMQLFSTGNAINHGKFSNSKYDNLVAHAASITDLELRRQLYTEAEQILTHDEMAIAPLYIEKQTILKKDNIKNLIVNPMDIVFLDKVVKI